MYLNFEKQKVNLYICIYPFKSYFKGPSVCGCCVVLLRGAGVHDAAASVTAAAVVVVVHAEVVSHLVSHHRGDVRQRRVVAELWKHARPDSEVYVTSEALLSAEVGSNCDICLDIVA